MTSPEGLFAAVLADAPSRPFVTFYDEASGERSELSAKSLANWVAKTHFLLTDELGLGVGDAAYIDLPAHWISVPVLLGCWTAGLQLTTDAASAAVAFTTAAPTVGSVPDVYLIAPDSAARGFGTDALPDATSDYVAAVRPQPDAWATVHPPASPADPAIDGVSRADVVAKSVARAGELGLARGARLLTAREWHGPDDWTDALLAPLAVGGSVVIVRGATAELITRRTEQERATSVLN
jgi:uncharacterized protein (TIGR03089 family)